MNITNTSPNSLLVSALGRVVDPGESVEIPDALVESFTDHPLFLLSGSQSSPLGQSANVAPVVEDTAVSESGES